MPTPSQLDFLTKLAELFRAEGDAVTADALMARCRSTSSRSICTEDGHRVLAWQRQGRRLDGRGAHEEAEAYFSRALQLMEDGFGPEHGNVIEHLNDLARCRFNAGDFEKALEDYTRLLRLTERIHGSEDGLVDIARHCVERCRKGLGQAIGAWRLQAQMDSMLKHTRDIRLVEGSHDLARMRDIARRLMARGRLSWAVRLYESWIGLRLRDAPPDDDLALIDIREYALELRRAGELARAAKVLQQVVTMRNRRSVYGGDNTELRNDLSEWQACLSESGQIRSATETARLAESIGKSRSVDRGAV